MFKPKPVKTTNSGGRIHSIKAYDLSLYIAKKLYTLCE
jgi:hypothetical protein